MLTFGQLAASAGGSVRTVRHYHQIGLLPEPARDGSGYRRYDIQATVDLIRIRTLAEAGVPLSRVDTLLHASPDELAAAVEEIDGHLQRAIEQMTDQRARIAALTSGEGLYLPPEVLVILQRARALGTSERTVRLERDSWLLMRALDPEAFPRWAEEKLASFEDPETVGLYLRVDRALDWEPDDPRLIDLVQDLDAWEVAHGRDGSDRGSLGLLAAWLSEASPTMRGILEELTRRAEARRSTSE